MKIDPHDRTLWVFLSLGVPALVALGVLAWGVVRTNVNVAIPAPQASPIVGIGPDGRPVPLAPTLAPATPTPPRLAEHFRIEGVLVDELGLPLVDACIEIGPNGCRDHSPRTDTRGVYFVDFPKAEVEYDLHFTKDGYRPQTRRIKPTADLVLNLVLAR